MADQETPTIVKCPKCNEEFSIAAIARRQAETTLTYELTLEPGHMVSAGCVGESITAFEKLMKVMSKDMGGTCLTLIKDMSFKDNKVRFDFLIVTNESALYKANKTKPKKSNHEQASVPGRDPEAPCSGNGV